ncbi:hypothetical protein NBRC13296_12300 [Paenibacillus chitinolyticus]|uniref:hypothetical protein n=1 Tax=Paenibacillus chitinolyticus TaxID=79263 RepID=UPI003557D8F1
MSRYYTAINKYGDLDVIDEDNGSVFMSISGCSNTDVRRCRSIIFDDADELVHFIQNEKACTDKTYYQFFSACAYEIINENYIKLYYEIVVSFT